MYLIINLCIFLIPILVDQMLIYCHNLLILYSSFLNLIQFTIIAILEISVLKFLFIVKQIIMLINLLIVFNSYDHNLQISYPSIKLILSPHHLKSKILILRPITVFKPIPLSSYLNPGLIILIQAF